MVDREIRNDPSLLRGETLTGCARPPISSVRFRVWFWTFCNAFAQSRDRRSRRPSERVELAPLGVPAQRPFLERKRHGRVAGRKCRGHAFQYVDWLFEGDDLIAASRTAYDEGLGGRSQFHDAHFLTFHRVRHFRNRPWPTQQSNVHDPPVKSEPDGESHRVQPLAEQGVKKARPAGFEPATSGLEIRCSIP